MDKRKFTSRLSIFGVVCKSVFIFSFKLQKYMMET